MRNYSIYIFSIILLFSCKKSITTCNNANLNNDIEVFGFPNTSRIEDFNVNIYEITENNTPRKMNIKSIFLKQEKYNYLRIILDEDLYANNTYQLNLNDTLKYKISELKTFSEVRIVGSREDSVCKTKSFKINDKIFEPFFSTGLNFRIPK